MSDFSVAAILRARPSLQARAREAKDIAVENEQHRRRMEEQDLVIEATAFMRDVLQCSDAEVEDLDFTRESYDSAGEKRQVSWVLDGYKFRANFKEEVIAEVTYGDKKEKIKDRALCVWAMSRSGQSWQQIASLADLGGVA